MTRGQAIRLCCIEICAPFACIVHFSVKAGQRVEVGDTLASVEAVKLEAPLLAPVPGVVSALSAEDFSDVAGGDVLLTIDAAPQEGQ